jgi:DNA-binding response OmpR family regulator
MLRDPISPRGTILVIDDEEVTGRMVRRHFPGWPVTQAYSIAAANDQLAADMPFCLVILDLNLGDTSYPEPLMENPWQGSFVLARRIRQAKPALPVVIFSACSNPANGHAARLAGAEYLSKHDAPGNLALLCRRLESAA